MDKKTKELIKKIGGYIIEETDSTVDSITIAFHVLNGIQAAATMEAYTSFKTKGLI